MSKVLSTTRYLGYSPPPPKYSVWYPKYCVEQLSTSGIPGVPVVEKHSVFEGTSGTSGTHPPGDTRWCSWSTTQRMSTAGSQGADSSKYFVLQCAQGTNCQKALYSAVRGVWSAKNAQYSGVVYKYACYSSEYKRATSYRLILRICPGNLLRCRQQDSPTPDVTKLRWKLQLKVASADYCPVPRMYPKYLVFRSHDTLGTESWIFGCLIFPKNNFELYGNARIVFVVHRLAGFTEMCRMYGMSTYQAVELG